MSYRKQFIVAPDQHVKLAGVDPGFTAAHKNKSDAAVEMEDDDAKLRDLQYLLYADNARSLLIVLQGLDASGKDGTIAHVFGALNPAGARVHQFKTPTALEAAHDFLWRVHAAAPQRGEIVIFNRSHYESVLIERVHGLVPKSVWSGRYDLINEFERNLTAAGTVILKFYLHMSEKEQLKRFKSRLDDPMRRWKISDADYAERSYFKDYLTAYEDMLERTSTAHAPWFVIPSDHKWFRNLAVSKIVVETLGSLGLHVPPTTVDLDEIRRKYHAAEHGG
ncbi:MAG TPA: polyphosphate kinase 2 family protein [Candidatus Acidoferrales bacterium]|nr:polyphosphate kinase 2 family protein [Candidatus Acidoferrales bacterium]